MASDSYQASYDVLSLTKRLELTLDGVTRAELHLLCYVACLLALYRRHPLTDWGYGFIRSQWGAPFSRELEEACEVLQANGLISGDGAILTATDRGIRFATFLDTVEEHRWRLPFIDGACASALAMPLGSIRMAIRQEPSLRRANIHQQPRALLGPNEDSALYEQFDALSQVLGADIDDLMVPSVVWLNYLNQIQLMEQETAGETAETVRREAADDNA